MKPEIIKSFSGINLKDHAVIEASAGTGKTHTIIQMFIRLLTEENAKINEILVLTFTEKAAGELKERIRNILDDDSSEFYNRKIFDEAKNDFDKAQIFTIHGFCNNLLNEFPFENRIFFKNNVVDDTLIYTKVLNDIIRKDFYDIYKDELEDILYLSGFNEAWPADALKTAKSINFTDDEGDRIIPDIDPDFTDKIKSVKGAFKKIDFSGIIKMPDPDKIDSAEDHSFFSVISSGINKNKINKTIRYLNRFLYLLKIKDRTFRDYISFMSDLEDDDMLKYLDPAHIFNKTTDEGIKNNKTWLAVSRVINEIFSAAGSRSILTNQLKSNTIMLLKRKVREYKRENGLISFSDMLESVHESVIKDGNFVSALRDRYKFALIDEFQDTDSIQWDIFKRIFFDSDKNKLFIIGDPKQAIYGFRGADVNTYIRAKKLLIKDHGYYYLNNNYRTSKDITGYLNILFGFDDGSPIWFTDENIDEKKPSQNPGQNKFEIKNDTIKQTVIYKIENNDKKKGLIKKDYACFISDEIKRLINVALTDKSGGIETDRKVNYNDIAVLCRTKSEISVIEQVFKDHGIPYSVYKKNELYKSDEAFHLSVMLDAVNEPSDGAKIKKALLTDFINADLISLKNMTDIPADSRLKNLTLKWHNTAVKKQWSQLFNYLIEDTGIFFKCMNYPDHERKITNYRHIIENILKETPDRCLNLSDIIRDLKNKASASSFETADSDLHRLETEDPKVQLMTIHASKGLEFPVVFVYSLNFTVKNSVKFFDKESGRITYDLTGSNEANCILEERHQLEKLFYVALTRASAKLYIPYHLKKTEKTFTIADAIDISLKSGNDNYSIIDPDNGIAKASGDKRSIDGSDQGSIRIIPDIFAPAEINFKKRMKSIYSFTSLSGSGKTVSYTVLDATLGEMHEDEFSGQPSADEAPDGDKLILVKGKHTGILFHEILENIDFTLFKNDKNSLLSDKSISDIIENKIGIYKTKLYSADAVDDKALKTKIIDILYKTLNKDLDGSGLFLSHLNGSDLIREFEFYLKSETVGGQSYILNGKIDLLFRYKDKYYILDWKTNFLDNYDEISVNEEISRSNYDLQYQIYCAALSEHLKERLNTANPYNHIGGIFYVFLRGINENDRQGIFFKSVSREEAEKDFINRINSSCDKKEIYEIKR